MHSRFGGAALLVVVGSALSFAETVGDLDPEVELEVGAVGIEGNDAFWDWTLSKKLLTRPRAWWAPWRSRPSFDPFTLEEDLARLRRFYESEGYYRIEIEHEIEVEDGLANVEIRLGEGERVVVEDVSIVVNGAGRPPSLPKGLPLESGAALSEEGYRANEVELKRFYLERTYALVEVEREATVDVATNRARLAYLVTPGPESAFGAVRVDGLETVEPRLVLREIEWEDGEPFLLERVRWTRENLLDLELFGLVKVGWEPSPEDRSVADMLVRVEEKPPRRVKIGVGYGTEDEFRTQFEWAHFNWLGGGRQLSAGLKLSTVTRSLESTFRQPHFLSRRTSGVLEFRQEQEDEDTFTLLGTHFLPRLEHRFTRTIRGIFGYRIVFAKHSDVDEETVAALGGIDREGIAAGPLVGLVYDSTDDPLDPRSGRVLSVFASRAGPPLGSGGYEYLRLRSEARSYHEIGADFVLAGRVAVGLGDPSGGIETYPVFDRFWAGGETSVRGYGRRRLGPKSSSDRPLGGLSAVEGSVELRRSIFGPLGGVLFVDFGQLSLEEYDPPVNDLDFSAGPGVTYATPFGPLSFFVGFPIDPPPGDRAWQVHFSIGQYF